MREVLAYRRNNKDRLFRRIFGYPDKENLLSSYNPNMPLRGLLYFARQYDKYVAQYIIRTITDTNFRDRMLEEYKVTLKR